MNAVCCDDCLAVRWFVFPCRLICFLDLSLSVLACIIVYVSSLVVLSHWGLNEAVNLLAAKIASSREGMMSPSVTSELASRRTAHNVAVKAAVNARLVSVPRDVVYPDP